MFVKPEVIRALKFLEIATSWAPERRFLEKLSNSFQGVAAENIPGALKHKKKAPEGALFTCEQIRCDIYHQKDALCRQSIFVPLQKYVEQ